ncbi:MAG: HEPN domain-containing protein [Desulfobulbaceae bacterium]
MDRIEIIEFWKFEAAEAMKVANHLFEKRDYSYALFFGHLAVEKLLKAIYVKNIAETVPRTHNLPRLAKEAGLNVSPEKQHDLIRITAFNLEARYPDYKREFRVKCTKSFTKTELEKIEEVHEWLRSIL